MKIAVVTDTYPPEVNGVALTVHTLVSEMAAAGHDILLVRSDQPGVSAVPPAHPIHELLVPGAAMPKYPGLGLGLPAGRTLARQFAGRRPDAVYVATEGPLGLSAIHAANRLGIPVATGFRTRFDDHARSYGLGPLSRFAHRWLRRLHNASTATIVPTTELGGWLEERGFQRVHVIARSVDTALFDPAHRDARLRTHWGIPQHGLAVIHVGRIAADKNLELAIQAFRRIREHRHDARFVWVGDGPQATRLQRENPDFIFAGPRLGEDLAAHFASGDLFLFPSLTEVFGNVTLEAMASGVPTVAFDYGAARAHLRDREHGRLVTRGNADGFIAAAVALATADAARGGMREAARAATLALRPEQIARDFVGLLARLPARATA
ncbi:MAG: glycosyltransferase family 1 protein [Pseudomonadota bacterium]|nr:glycosyltransferase family 1 protein [Pseudomonadota bacterium]